MKRLDTLPQQQRRLLALIEQHAPAPVYLVGGAVRDLLIGRNSADFDLDLVTEADAPTVVAALVAQLGGSQTTHQPFATATWQLPADLATPISHIDFATTRTERYPQPAQLPTVTVSTLDHDLARRDFSINAIALPLHGDRLIDPHNGQVDLQNGRLRLLNRHSLRDDPTRLLRAARFEQRFNFTFASNLVEQMADGLRYLPDVTGPRITNELDKISAEPDPAATMARLDQLGVFEQIVPNLCWQSESAGAYAALDKLQTVPAWQQLLQTTRRRNQHYVLWLQPLPEVLWRATCQKLQLPNSVQQALANLNRLLPTLLALPTSAPASSIDATLSHYTKSPLSLIAARAILAAYPIAQQIDQWQAEWRHFQLSVNGDDLRRLGLPPGPAYKAILAQLRALRIDGDLVSAEEHDYLAQQAITYQQANEP